MQIFFAFVVAVAVKHTFIFFPQPHYANIHFTTSIFMSSEEQQHRCFLKYPNLQTTFYGKLDGTKVSTSV